MSSLLLPPSPRTGEGRPWAKKARTVWSAMTSGAAADSGREPQGGRRDRREGGPRPTPTAADSPLQAPAHVVMVRPHRFTVNPETAADNAFQRPAAPQDRAAPQAYAEVTRVAEALEANGVGVSLFDDEVGLSPDSVFPNNWFLTDHHGRVLLCPMFAVNRRHERRADVVAHLHRNFTVTQVLDWSAAEDYGQFLEGTGAVVIDHVLRVAYGCRSHRLSAGLFTRFCREFDLRPVLFDAADSTGRAIYHTNVMMSVGESVALVASGLITDPKQRAEVLGLLEASGRTVVELDETQVRSFAGNVLQLTGDRGLVMAMSTTAEASLRKNQIELITAAGPIVAADVSTVEASGGSVRCMLAGIHLPPGAPQSARPV